MKILVVEPDEAIAADVVAQLEALAVTATAVTDAESGWNHAVEAEPDIILAAPETPRGGCAGLVRRVEARAWTGARPRVWALVTAADLEVGLEGIPLDGVLVRPVEDDSVRALVEPPRARDAAAELQRLRRLFPVTALGADDAGGQAEMLRHVAAALGADDCFAWGADASASWQLSASDEASDLAGVAWPAARVPAPVIIGDAAILAVPLPLAAGTGGIALVRRRGRCFDAGERDALALVAGRLGVELSWLSAHRRVLDDRDQLRQSALVDALTGLWTRDALDRALTSGISAARRRGEALSLAVFDVRQLRRVNDGYGHAVGDRALAHVARVIRANVRAQDTVARIGGDEIAVLLTGADGGRAGGVAAKLVELVAAAPLVEETTAIPLQLSATIAEIVPAADQDGQGTLARCLAALEQARGQDAPVLLPVHGDEVGDGLEDAVGDRLGEPTIGAGVTLGGMYQILHELSRGAMGVVYRGRDLGLGRTVAIKVLRTDLARDRQLVARFRAEAAMLASLRHRNLVQVYAFGAQGEDIYFVMELVEGQALSDVLDRLERSSERLELDVVAQVVEEIADALEAMHALGLIHRDVKPANILLDHINDRAVLVDVGVAKRREDRGDAAGTPGFSAPESFMDTAESSATDVYALAATAYAMLTNEVPFGSGDLEQVVERQLYEPIRPPSSHRRELHRAVDDVLLKALAPEQPSRYTSAAAFAVALGSALKRSRSSPRPPTAPGARRTTGRIPGVPERPPSARPEAAVQAPREVRGVLFRILSRLLVHHLGAHRAKRIAEAQPELAPLLEATLPPLGWHPRRLLVALLRDHGDERVGPRQLAEATGRASMTTTLARFLGADLATLTPQAVVRTAEAWWPRYHRWCTLKVDAVAADSARLSLVGPDLDPLLVALTTASLARAVELGGGSAVHVAPSDDAGTLALALRWTGP